jgi:hypothetical protein
MKIADLADLADLACASTEAESVSRLSLATLLQANSGITWRRAITGACLTFWQRRCSFPGGPATPALATCLCTGGRPGWAPSFASWLREISREK